jgi:hypothetical protein
MKKYNVMQIIQSPDIDNNEPVEVRYASGTSEIGAASAVAMILDRAAEADMEEAEGNRSAWDPNLRAIKVYPVPIEPFDLLERMQQMQEQLQRARNALLDEAEGRLRQATFRMSILADEMHNFVANW